MRTIPSDNVSKYVGTTDERTSMSVANLGSGTVFIEEDTLKCYMYSESASDWIDISDSGILVII